MGWDLHGNRSFTYYRLFDIYFPGHKEKQVMKQVGPYWLLVALLAAGTAIVGIVVFAFVSLLLTSLC